MKICITLGPNPRNNKTSLNLTLRYTQYFVVHEFTSVHFLQHRMNNIEFHFTCIKHILNDLIQQISSLRGGDSLKEEVYPKPKLGMFWVLSQEYQHWFEKQYKYLGLEANCLETWKLHKISVSPGVIWINLCKSVNFLLWNLAKIRRYIDRNAASNAMRALILSKLDYGNALLSSCKNKDVALLQRLQNRAARIVFQVPRRHSSSPQLASLHWLPIDKRIKFKILLHNYKALNDLSPVYLTECITIHLPSREGLRSSVTLLVSLSQGVQEELVIDLSVSMDLLSGINYPFPSDLLPPFENPHALKFSV